MRSLITVLLLMVYIPLTAQNYLINNITINLPATPDANTANWKAGASMLTISAISPLVNNKIDPRVQESKMLVTIMKGNTRVCGTFTSANAPSSNFTNINKVWPGANAISYLGQDCTLPPGEYQVCVQFFGSYPIQPLSAEKCKIFTIPAPFYQKPTALLPADNAIFTLVQAAAPITFKWTPVVPAYNSPVTYRLKVWQLMSGQSKAQAMNANQPIINQDVTNLTQKIITNIMSTGCQSQNSCAFVWNIQSLNAQGQPIGNNNGVSNANYFTVSTNETNQPPVVKGSSADVGDTIRAGENGEFLIKVTTVTNNDDGSITGKATVDVGWLSSNIAVEFDKIKIDSTKRLIAGGIITQKTTEINYLQAWLTANLTAAAQIPADGVIDWTNNKIDDIVSWVNNNNFQFPDVDYQANLSTAMIPPNSLKMPFGVKFNDPDNKLIVTEMMFGPNASKVNFIVQKKFTRGVTDYKLGFAGKYFLMHQERIVLSQGRLELAENIHVPNLAANPKMNFIFKKGSAQQGCFIEWDSTGVKQFGLDIDVKFTRDWLLPVPTATDSVTATLSGSAGSLKDILITGGMPLCEIVGSNGMQLKVDSIALDLSETRNAGFMYFPANYTNDTSAQAKLLWEGLYIKTQKLTLPDNWKTGANPTQISITNTLIDDQGLTMKARAINVITFPIGRVSDMSASLDTLQVSMLKGSLTDASAKGKLVLPISKDTISNALKYTATFSQANLNEFQVVIVPSGPIDAEIMKGKITLSPTSNITSAINGNSVSASITLNGNFSWNDPSFTVPATNDTLMSSNTGSFVARSKGIKGIKMAMDFQNLKLDYTNNWANNTNDFHFNPGNWSLASPQKLLANFPVTLKNFRFKELDKSNTSLGGWKEYLRGAVLVDVIANLTEEIGGTTTLGVAFAIEGNLAAKKLRPKYKGISIDSLHINANVSAVKMEGYLKMYDNDLVFGDGFLANLKVNFNPVAVQVNALVQFGNTTYLNNAYYRYWRAEADAKFNPGIPFLTGVGFYGFGGGAFYNMQPTLVQKAAPETGYKYVFTPKKSSLGLIASTTIATLPKFETLNADVKLLAQFSTSGGITQIGFTGDVWLASSLAQRPGAKIKGGMAVTYNFPNKIFYTAAQLSINVPPAITTPSPVGFVMNIDGKQNKWYFKSGTPANPNTVQVFGANLYSYLMFGNDIPAPNGFTQAFINNYATATGSPPSNNVGNGGVGTATTTGKGIATGVGVQFSQNIDKKIYSGTCRNWYIAGNVMAGAELNLALMHETGCVGINGYRASGNLGLYGSVDAGITGTSFKGVCDDKYYNLFRISSGAWIEGKFPNTEYMRGELSAQINLFGGLIDVSYNQTFQRGNNCSGTPVNTPDAPQEDEAAEYQNQLIQSIAPNNPLNFPVTSPINVKYALTPDNVFDVSENQGNGTSKNRTFKLTVVPTLEIRNPNGTWSTLNTTLKASNTGEYQYCYKPPLNTMVANQGSVSIATVNIATANFNANNSSNIISVGNQLQVSNLYGTVPPPPPPNYPNPVQPPVNQLEKNRSYRFKVVATLMEFINGTWVKAITRSGVAVTQTKTFLFKTGEVMSSQVSSVQ